VGLPGGRGLSGAVQARGECGGRLKEGGAARAVQRIGWDAARCCADEFANASDRLDVSMCGCGPQGCSGRLSVTRLAVEESPTGGGAPRAGSCCAERDVEAKCMCGAPYALRDVSGVGMQLALPLHTTVQSRGASLRASLASLWRKRSMRLAWGRARSLSGGSERAILGCITGLTRNRNRNRYA
jgi:hypothetical protein